MSFLRHVGKNGDRKVAVIFREVPGETHMCLVTYTELLNQNVHDPMMQCIESEIGQNSENLADALNRSFTKDGRSILQVLHAEGQLKKVQTESIVMTPSPNTRIKLSELNVLLDEMQQGEAAVKRMAEMDKSMGMQDPGMVRKMRGKQPETVSTTGDLLGDQALARQRIEQAQKMEREAQGLLVEAKRLMEEASTLDPSTKAKAAPKTATKTTVKAKATPKAAVTESTPAVMTKSMPKKVRTKKVVA